MSNGRRIEVRFLDKARLQHFYIAGLSGYGKSSLMRAMASQDIQHKHGVTVLDPKGDLAEAVLSWVPRERIDDTIYLSAETPVPLDVMSFSSDEHRSILAQDLLHLFKRFMDLGERMEPVLKWTINTLLEAKNCCFFDFYTFLADMDGARQKILDRVHNPDLRHYWRVEFQKPYYRGAEVPILSRMTDFKLIPSVNKILGNPNAQLKIQDVVDSRKILIVNLGSFGPDACTLLGILISAQIQQAMFHRGPIPENERVPHFLFADEFQNFKNYSFNKIVQEARGFGLGLTLANLHPKQIPDLIDDIKGSVTSYMFFKMDGEHARVFASKLGHFSPAELAHLPKFSALYHGPDGTTRQIPTPFPAKSPSSYAQDIKNRMIEKYTCDIPPNPDGPKNEPQPDPQRGEGSTAKKAQHVSIHPKRTPPRTANPRVQDKPDSEFFE